MAKFAVTLMFAVTFASVRAAVTANISVTANFAINTFTLTYTAGANGTITGTSPQTVNYNTSGTAVTAVPNTGFHFVNWSDGVLTAARTDANVTANISVTANFAINTFTITASAGANGTIAPSGIQTVNYGSNQTFTITPTSGYHVASVLVDGDYVGGVTSFTFTNVTAAHTIAATFVINGQAPVILGTSGRFAILSDQAITNTGATTSITGDVGQSPITGAAITGLASTQVSGTIYTVDGSAPTVDVMDPGMLTTAKNDASNARTDAMAVGRGSATPIVGNLAGQTLYPGLYSQGTLDLSVLGTVTLDAQGDSSAVFIIRSAATIILNNNSVVSLTGRAQARNVFWVGGDVTLNLSSQMKGTIIANTFDLKTGATLDGRMLIPNGGAAVTLITNTIALPTQ